MKVNTALSFFCLGAGLWLAGNQEQQRSRSILGLLVTIIAGSTLAEYVFHISLGIDQLLFRDTRTPSLSAYPGRMAIATAICFLLLGSAVMFLGLKKALVLQRALVVACFAFSLTALCGYLYGADSLYSITSFSTVGVHTAAGLMAACLAYFLARPNEGIVSIAASDSNSGFLLRTLGPAIVVVPILIGRLRLAGQRANLYDTPFGTALLVLVSIGSLAALTMLVARSMYRWECESSHSEKMIRESEERFRLVADTAPALIWTSGINKLCTYVNKSWLDFTGRSIVFELGNGWVEGVHPEDLQRCLGNYTQSFDRREKFSTEYRRLRHDGEYRWILDIGVPRFHQDRSFVGYIGIGVDVTERRRIEEVLQQREMELTEAQRLAGVGSWQWDAKIDKVIWSEELYRLHGLDPKLPAPSFKEHPSLFTAESWQRLQAVVKEALQTGAPYELDVEILRPESTTKWATARGEPLRDAGDQIIGFRGTVQDITERKQAEEALRESEDKLRLLLDSTAEAIYGIDLEHRCTFCNTACLHALGYEHVDQVLGKNMHDLLHHSRADGTVFPVEECRVHRVIQTGERFHAEDEVFWKANGRSFPAEYWSYPQRRGQRLVGAVVAFIDITERKLAEAELGSVKRKLIEAQEQERTRIGRELHDDINQRLAMLAIEIAQLEANPSEVRSRVQELRKQTIEISDDVQALSHELDSSKLDYLGAIGGMRGWCEEFGERQGIQVEFKSPGAKISLPREIGLCLFRVLQEALHNAAKHSGVRRIEVQLREEAGEIHLLVSDLGRGFDLETATQGRGLGLVSMQERVRLINGIIEIQSKPMGGTTIHVRVPLRPDHSQHAAG